jgi:hypothetical protein
MTTARQRLQTGAPDDRKNDLMPTSWFEAWSAAALATDPVGSKRDLIPWVVDVVERVDGIPCRDFRELATFGGRNDG